MAQPRTVTAYVVHNVNWQYNDERYYRCDGELDAPLCVFLDRKKAQAYALELERRRARGNLVNGLNLAGTESGDWSSLPPTEIVARLRAAGIVPAREEMLHAIREYEPERNEMADDTDLVMTWLWYATLHGEPHEWTEHEQEVLWAVFDRQRQFVVVEMPVEMEA